MNVASVRAIKQIFAVHATKPKKSLGQNFLVDRHIIEKMVAAAEIQPTDVILEVGPGIGALTQELVRAAKRVIAVEKDKEMVEILERTLVDCGNLEILNQDIRGPDTIYPLWGDLGPSRTSPKRGPQGDRGNIRYKVVANLPYFITGPVLRKFLEQVQIKPERIVLMVQKEVAQRICARPPKMNLLAVSVQLFAEPKIVSYVKRTSFWPQPEVDSAIIKITPYTLRTPMVRDRELLEYTTTPRLRDQFFRIVKAGFKQPRKQLANNLSKGLGLPREKVEQRLLSNHIQPSQRAQTLSVGNWINLTKSFDISHLQNSKPLSRDDGAALSQ